MTTPLFTPQDHALLRGLAHPDPTDPAPHRGTYPNPLDVEREAAEVERLLAFYDLVEDKPGSQAAGSLYALFHVLADHLVDAQRTGTPEEKRDSADELTRAVAVIRTHKPKREQAENKLTSALRSAVQNVPRVAGLLDLAREYGKRADEAWAQLDDATVKQPALKVIQDYEKAFTDVVKPTPQTQQTKTARYVTPPKPCSEETLESLIELARTDHAVSQLLSEKELYCAELRSDQLLHRLAKYPHARVKTPYDYVRVSTPSGVLVMLPSSWVLGPKALLTDLSKGTLPASSTASSPTTKAASMNLRPTWALRSAAAPTQVSTSTSYPAAPQANTLRVTFTSNAMRDPNFEKVVKELKGQPVGGCTIDFPVGDQGTPAYLTLKLKQLFGYPAKVIELLTGLDGESPPYYNRMSKYAAAGKSTLWSLQFGTDAPSLREVSAGAVQVLDRSGEVLYVARGSKDAAVWAELYEKAADKAVSRIASWKPLKASQQLALHRLQSPGARAVAAKAQSEAAHVGHVLVLHPKDFVRVGSRAVYQPTVGEELTIGDLTGIVEQVFPLSSDSGMKWLAIRDAVGALHFVSRPDTTSRCMIWQDGQQAVTDDQKTVTMPVVITSPSDVAQEIKPVITTMKNMLWDNTVPCGALRAFEPQPEEVGCYLPMDGNVALDGRYLSQREIENRAIDKGQKPQWVGASFTVQRPYRPLTPPMEPLTTLIQESGTNNPMFIVPQDFDAIEPDRGDTSSEAAGFPSAVVTMYDTQNPGNDPQTRTSPPWIEYDTKNLGSEPAIASAQTVRTAAVEKLANPYDLPPVKEVVNPYKAR